MHPAGHGARLAALAAAWLAGGCDHPDVNTGAVLDQEQRPAIVTQVAERREGAWRQRSAHWSSLRPPP